MLPDSHVDSEGGGAGWRVEGFAIGAGVDVHRSGCCQESDDEDGIRDGVGTVGDSLEIVAGVYVRRLGGVVRRVAAGGFQGWTVPVDDLVVGDIVVYGGGTGLVCSDEWLGHFEPTIVRPASTIQGDNFIN